MEHFTRNLNLFNRMRAYPYRELLEDGQEKTSTKNKAWSHPNVDVRTENFRYFIRFLRKINQFTFPI